MYKVIENKQTDKNLEILWTDIKILDEATGNYILYRQDWDANGYKFNLAKIDDRKFARNNIRMKKDIKAKLEAIEKWANENVFEK